MFTSRAEHRLLLRADTADRRLTPKGRAAGLIGDERWERFLEKCRGIDLVKSLLTNGQAADSSGCSYPAEWLETAALDVKYAGYIRKEQRLIDRRANMEKIKLPPGLDYANLAGLSAESREKLAEVRPLTIGQASRIGGIRQSDLAFLITLMEKRRGASPQTDQV
jgi:tRNA uridine 5-carboxymethylaminomethyl modification enzyme